jgi:hypothetical protein
MTGFALVVAMGGRTRRFALPFSSSPGLYKQSWLNFHNRTQLNQVVQMISNRGLLPKRFILILLLRIRQPICGQFIDGMGALQIRINFRFVCGDGKEQ